MGIEQENAVSVRITRGAAKKRAAAEQSLQQPATKKRVVLGEITNLTNNRVVGDLSLDVGGGGGLQKRQTRSNKQKVVVKNAVEVHSDDPQMCVTYAADIYEYLHSMEIQSKRRPMSDYIEKIQKDVTAQMRGILVDWLVEVAEEYKLVSDTLYLTVSYLDRYLSSNVLNRQRLQLLGVSCMLIASKYEEISPPHVEDFCYITDNTYTKQEVVKMESDILKLLNFEMGNPTVKTFLRRFTRTAQGNCQSPNLQLEFLGCYLAELSLLDYACISFLPSMVAASVIFLTNFTIQPKKHPWNLTLQQQSNYRPSDLKDCVSAIHDLQLNRKGGSLVSIRDKYKQHKVCIVSALHVVREFNVTVNLGLTDLSFKQFKCVATLNSPPEIPTEYFEDVKTMTSVILESSVSRHSLLDL
ncbi:Cyclin-a3-2 [Thalictrum thalictroides]|uniref:Cyclin-a3-2 n=1 Tax=Thalictrum thalictroides TaxID=46969 RepID=A0A7J6VXW9_THATH|nr:Cyclin-a3-2 [Thalictrum thalictroides]